MSTYSQLPINFTKLAQFLLNLELAQAELVELSIKINNYEHRAVKVGDGVLYMHILQAEFDIVGFHDEVQAIDIVLAKLRKVLGSNYTIGYHYMGNGNVSLCLIDPE